jgi:hypothetical protein
MFHIGVDVGVIPQTTQLIPLPPPVLNSIGCAVSAAAMNENRINLHTRCQTIKGSAVVAFPCYMEAQGADMPVVSPDGREGYAPKNPVVINMAHRRP